MITGIMLGSLLAGRVAHFWRPERTIRIGFGMMIGAAVVNVLYASFFTVAIPWAVLPILLCTFGMAFVSPAMTIVTLDLYPSRRGMAASLQSAFVMGAFSIYSGLVVPFLFGSALKLAVGVLAGFLASVALWACGQRQSQGHAALIRDSRLIQRGSKSSASRTGRRGILLQKSAFLWQRIAAHTANHLYADTEPVHSEQSWKRRSRSYDSA